jgi:hypothetical protein
LLKNQDEIPNEPKHGRTHLCNVIYTDGSFCPDSLKTWPPQAILASDWLCSENMFSSKATWPNEEKLGSFGLFGLAVSEDFLKK